MNKLKDKVAVVTGGASGIGRATAVLFADEGAHVIVADIDEAGATETIDFIIARGGSARAKRTDISREADARELTNSTIETFGSLDVLVNNAALFLRRGCDTATGEDWSRIMGTNVAGTALCSRYAAEAMRDSGRGGSIVVVSSMNGIRADRGYATYCASKAALLMLTRCMALDFSAWNIRVNCIAPGAVETPALVSALREADLTIEEFVPIAEQNQCLPGIVQPEDVARAILFVAGDDARMITGTTLLVDAGWQAGK